MQKFVINGGGMVGAAAALALAQRGHHVTLIDSQPLPTESDDWDLRISSVNDNHWQWLLSLGIADHLDPSVSKYRPYTGLSVATQTGQQLSFEASDIDRQQLGVMIENNTLQRALWRCLSEYDNVDCLAPATIEQLDIERQQLKVNGEQREYHVLIGADGGQSFVARQANIGYRGWDYSQRCLLATVRLRTDVAASTWQVFRPEGPYALLPLTRQQACLIDYRGRHEVSQLCNNRQQLEAELRSQFGSHIGDFELLRYASFPLQRKQALRYHRYNSIVLMGDAAHTIHPLAGQGVNLGFADVRRYVADPQQLDSYEQQGRRDNTRMMRAMDLINWGLGGHRPLLNLGLTAGFKMLQTPMCKRQLIKQAMQL